MSSLLIAGISSQRVLKSLFYGLTDDLLEKAKSMRDHAGQLAFPEMEAESDTNPVPDPEKKSSDK